jgi:hypothetical protein
MTTILRHNLLNIPIMLINYINIKSYEGDHYKKLTRKMRHEQIYTENTAMRKKEINIIIKAQELVSFLN